MMNNNFFEDSESKAEWCAYRPTEPNFVESISILFALALTVLKSDVQLIQVQIPVFSFNFFIRINSFFFIKINNDL